MVHRTMRKVAVIILCFVSQLGLAALAEAQITKTYNFSSANLVFSKDRGYDIVRFRDAGDYVVDVAMPNLPLKNLTFIIPTRMRVAQLEVTSLQEDTLPGEYFIFPTQPPRVFDVPPPPFVLPDSIVYNSNIPYPANAGQYIREGYVKEAHIVTVQLHPFRWIPRIKKLVITKSLRVNLSFSTANEGPLEALRRSARAQFDFEQYIARIVDNPEDISKYLTKPPKLEIGYPKGKNGQVGKLVITSLPSLEGIGPEYVIITNQACSTAFQALADWKMEKGLPAVIRTTEWIVSRYPGGDLQEKIRHFIKEAYLYWGTDYFLLGGGTSIIPGRRVYTTPWGYHDVLCDLYYAGLNGNWNSDGDSLFGEQNSQSDPAPDYSDIDPDVWVGRIPINNAAQASVVIGLAPVKLD